MSNKEFFWHVSLVLSNVSYKFNYRLLARQDPDGGRVYLQVECLRPDAFTGEMDKGRGGKVYLSQHMTDGEIVRKAFGALLAYEEHEAREFFRYKGKQVFGPHIHIDALVEVADRLETRD